MVPETPWEVVLAAPYRNELGKLQDKIPAMPVSLPMIKSALHVLNTFLGF